MTQLPQTAFQSMDVKVDVEVEIEKKVNPPKSRPKMNLEIYYSEEKYEKIKRLGYGTYGTVHEVVFHGESKTVALKKFSLETNELTSTTLREISTLKSCSHPNILTVLDTFYKIKNDVISFYMCTPVYSSTLRKYYLNNSNLNFQSLYSIIFQLSNGLDYLHMNGFLHRDLKPENIFINERELQVVIGDFGLSRRYYNNCQPLKMTAEVCTLYYKSPELLLGIKNYTSASDIWSLGMIFSELLLKKRLCAGDSDTDQLHCIFKLLGTPTKDDLTDILESHNIDNIPSFPIWLPTFDSTFSDIDMTIFGSTVDLIRDILIIDPRDRPKRLIDHPYFNTNGDIDCRKSNNTENDDYEDELYCFDAFSQPIESLQQYKSALKNEEQIETNYLVNHPDLKHKMIQLLIDWLTDVHVKFKLVNNSYHRCIQLIYKFLSVSHNIKRTKLQLVGVTCLHISSKLEEIYGCEIKDMVYITDNAFTQFDIEEMERIITTTLDFDIVKPMPIEFLRLYSHFSDFDSELHTVSKFLLELALTSIELKSMLPSHLALYVTTKTLELQHLIQKDPVVCESSVQNEEIVENPVNQHVDYTNCLKIVTKQTPENVIHSDEYIQFDKFITNCDNNIYKCREKDSSLDANVENTENTISDDNVKWRWALYQKYKIRFFGVAKKLYLPNATPLFPLTYQ